MKPAALLQAIDAESYNWMEKLAPDILGAIESDLRNGKTPAELKRLASVHLGPERAGLVLRIEQASRHIVRKQSA